VKQICQTREEVARAGSPILEKHFARRAHPADLLELIAAIR